MYMNIVDREISATFHAKSMEQATRTLEFLQGFRVVQCSRATSQEISNDVIQLHTQSHKFSICYNSHKKTRTLPHDYRELQATLKCILKLSSESSNGPNFCLPKQTNMVNDYAQFN